jgi:polyvinyl alcohol dehydrogenase (cytochrome)
MNLLLEMTAARVVAIVSIATAVLQLVGCSTDGKQPPAEQVSTAQAETIYRERCASCHDGSVPRAASPAGLRNLSSERIRVSLTTGVMREQGQGLTLAQLDALSRHLGGAAAAPAAQTAATRCAASPTWPSDALAKPRWNGWGADVAQQRLQPAVMAQLASTDVPRLRLKWAYGVADTIVMNAQPTIVGGRIFMGGAKVVSLDAASGCTHWDFTPDARVRSAMTTLSLRLWLSLDPIPKRAVWTAVVITLDV